MRGTIHPLSNSCEIEGKNMVRVVVAGEKDIREMLAKEAVALGNAMLSCEEEKKDSGGKYMVQGSDRMQGYQQHMMIQGLL